MDEISLRIPLDSGLTQIISHWRTPPITDVDELDAKLDPLGFAIAFAYHSAKIENNKLTYFDTKEIFEKDRVVGYTGDIRDLLEVRNMKNCWESLRHDIIKRTPLNEEFIKKVHFSLLYGCYDERRYTINGERPGEYKRAHYVVGLNDTGAHPDDVAEEMKELLLEIGDFQDKKSSDIKNILKTAAYFHARFENIHPFADGNGRTGRALMNYFLMVMDCPPLVIREETRMEYFDSLEQYNSYENIEPLTNFLISSLEHTWRKLQHCSRQKKRKADFSR